jgi:Zn-finger protein
MSIKETIDLIKEAVQERISSPILGTFAFFLFGFNWETVVIVWKTQLPIEAAIQSIESTRITWTRGFILPAICTFGFCLIYPWLKYFLSWYTDAIDTKRVLKRHNCELKIIRNRKDILVAEGELEGIREARLQEVERKKMEFEFELQKRSHDIDLYEQQNKINAKIQLKEYESQQEIRMERRLNDFRNNPNTR